MKTIKQSNLLDEPVDALIYSTNVLLNLTGGVGAQLLERFGTSLQTSLHNQLRAQGKRFATRGDAIELVLPSMPWKIVFHTIPCDPMYHTTPEIVARTLRRCFDRCLERGDIASVATSAIATGYGDMVMEDFISIFDDVTGDARYAGRLDIRLCLPLDE